MIESGKRVVWTMVVKIPPGMEDANALQFVASNLMWSEFFRQFIEQSQMQVAHVKLPDAGKIIQ